MPIKVFDFFSGCGGTSSGLQAAGMEVVLGLDIDPDASLTFQTNFPDAHFITRPIQELRVEEIALHAQREPGDVLLFSGCAPCQPFSQQNKGALRGDTRVPLLAEFGRFVRHYAPELVFIENVPGLQKVSNRIGPFRSFLRMLHTLNYSIEYGVLNAVHYGVPQYRRRLVLMASRIAPIELPEATHGQGTNNPEYSTVGEWINHLPPIAAGETHPDIPNHQATRISELNIRRLRATPEGGGRRDWPDELVLQCHSGGYTGHTDVYGRLTLTQPASCLTTKCTSISNGRFGHPRQDRAISVREAACLQTFDAEFIFHGGIGSAARQVGNAVPVLMAQRVGEAFVAHVDANQDLLHNGYI